MSTYSSIKFAGMEALISHMTSAGSTLQDTTGTLQTKAGGLGVSSPAFSQIIAIGAWAEEALPGLKRRLALAQAMNHEGGKLPASVTIDEDDLSTLTPAEARAAAEKDAKTLEDHMGDNGANGSGLDDETADSIYANMNDPYYAAAFARAYPPGEMAKVLQQLNTQEEGAQQIPDPDDDPAKVREHLIDRQTKLLTALGTTAATASRGTGDLAPPDDYAQQFLDAMGAGDAKSIPTGGPASVVALLKNGSWSPKFKTDYAKGLVEFMGTEEFQQQNQPGQDTWFERLSYGTPAGMSSPMVVHTPDGKPADWDPTTQAMDMMADDPTVAQSVLIDPDATKTLSSTNWQDDGDAYGKAVESATTHFRGQDTAGKDSARIASNVVSTLNADELNEDGHLQNMRDSMGRVLGGYIIDISRVANGGSDTGVPGVYASPYKNGDNPNIPGVEPPGATFDLDQLKSVMSATETDSGAFKTVAAASTALSSTMMDTAAKQAAAHPGANQRLAQGTLPIELRNATTNASKLQGMVISTGDAGNIHEGEVNDANREAALSMIRGAVDMVPIPGGKLVEYAASQGEDALFEQLQSDDTGEATIKANDTDSANRQMMERMAVRAMTNNGLTKDTDISPDAFYERNGIAPGARFTGADGHLLSGRELASNPGARTAYEAWLQDNKSPMGASRGDVDATFESAYDNWGQ